MGPVAEVERCRCVLVTWAQRVRAGRHGMGKDPCGQEKTWYRSKRHDIPELRLYLSHHTVKAQAASVISLAQDMATQKLSRWEEVVDTG